MECGLKRQAKIAPPTPYPIVETTQPQPTET
jgi:hypothetical protein